ncbi:MAG: translation initiation factor IF-2 [Desulfovibrionaceae bacterium]|nr:translation initiation factor IF-2 [Desulfovibrionaceae bacterium]
MLVRSIMGLLLLLLLCPMHAVSKSAYSPRASGTEPPGGPQENLAIPAPSNFGRTQEGGLGYTDAYGNTISSEPKPTPPKKRLPQGAYGRYAAPGDNSPLPDPQKAQAKPVWSFH